MSTYEAEHELAAFSPDTEASAVAHIAVQGVEPHPIEPGLIVTVPDGRGGVKVIDTDSFAEHPRLAKAKRTVTDAASFVAYVERHGSDATEVWADTPNSTVVAVIDSNEGAGKPAGWEGHRLALSLEKTDAWKAWAKADGQWFAQLDFAEFIEDRASDVKTPSSADLLELAQSFQAARKVDFESSERMKDGQTNLAFKETVAAKAGQKGNIVIPDELLLVLKPYVGGPAYHVVARFRYRLNGATLGLGIVLQRPQEILDAAFADVVTAIREGEKARDGWPEHGGISQPIFYGRP